MIHTESIKATHDSPPRWVWRMTLGGAGLVALVTGLAVIALALGAADPPVAGPVRWSDETLAWAGGPVIGPSGDVWAAAPLDSAVTPGAFTISVRARAEAGSAWGIWLESGDGARAVYAITADGYVTIRRCPADPPADVDTCPALRPEWRWSPYPRIDPPGSANTLTLHREPSGAIRLRINDERLGAAPLTISGRWGVWARGAVTWERATVR